MAQMRLRVNSALMASVAIVAIATTACDALEAAGLDTKACAYNGIPLWGKVAVVEHFPDFTVAVVDAFPDLKVKTVEHFADDCGEWIMVDAFADFSIAFVESFPDLRIRWVEHFPGID